MIYRVPALAAVAILAGYVGFNAADRQLPVRLKSVEVAPPQVRAGEMARRVMVFDRFRTCETKAKQMLFTSPDGARRFVLPDLEFGEGLLPLGIDPVEVPFRVPDNAPPGPAEHVSVNCYVCNFTHRWWPLCAPPRRTPFMIVE